MASLIRPPAGALSLLDALETYSCPWRDFAEAFEGEVLDTELARKRLSGLCGVRRFSQTAPFPAPTDQDLWLAAVAHLLTQLAQGRLHAWAIEDAVRGGWVEIKPNIWAFIDVEEIDWYHGRVSLPGQTVYDVRVAPAAAVPPLASKAGRRKGGRKRTYDWPAFQREAIRLLEYEALPVETNEEGWRCQADLEKRMTKWCEDNWPKVPVESQIRTHTVKAIETFCEGRKGQ